jgi:hypothetical protein
VRRIADRRDRAAGGRVSDWRQDCC